jgi:hypothetical protein
MRGNRQPPNTGDGTNAMNRSAPPNANEVSGRSAFAEGRLAGDPGGNRTPRPSCTGSEPRRLQLRVEDREIDRFDGGPATTYGPLRQSVFGTSCSRSSSAATKKSPWSAQPYVYLPRTARGVRCRPQSGQFRCNAAHASSCARPRRRFLTKRRPVWSSR